MTPTRMRGAAEAADARAFTGRQIELEVVGRFLDDATPSRVLYVHGPGGIGKSALLREAARRAAALGFAISSFDARTLPAELDLAVGRILGARSRRWFVIIDEADALGSGLNPLRDRLLDALPDAARLAIAGRHDPDRSWREHGLHAIVVDLPVRPLSDDEASRLLIGAGMASDRIPEVVAWSQGSPLALTIAATVPAGRPGKRHEAELEERLTSWLAGRAMLDVSPDVLEVAALTRTVDARLIAAALPSRPTREAMRQLAALPVVERAGDAVILHSVLASVIRTRLRATAPERARMLTRRIVEHLGIRARLGDIDALIEMSLFIENPELRRALSNQPSATHYSDGARAGELSVFAATEGFDRHSDWAELRAWIEHQAPYTVVMRRTDGAILLFGAFEAATSLTVSGPVTESLADAAAQSGADPERSFVGVVMFADASMTDRAEAARLGTGALMHQHGVADTQAILIHYPEPDRRPQDVVAAIAHDMEGRRPRPVALSDFRPGGAVGFVEGIVLREQGFSPRTDDPVELLAPNGDPQREDRLRTILDRVFDSTAEDRRLRRAIELAHLGPRRPEQECLESLHVSRRTWFRLLREARERVLAYRG